MNSNEDKLQATLQPSGLNSFFCGEDLSFDEYIELMKNIIATARIDVHSENSDKIILANSPFSLKSSRASNYKNGILLIHGLYDSPFYVKDLGDYFHSRGFLVRAILLPGHGTVPGDLLNIDYKEWIKAVQYGVRTLANEVENIYIAGHSLGGLLALHEVLFNQYSNIKGLILFAPALGIKSHVRLLLAKYHSVFTWMSSRAKWYYLSNGVNIAKYSCYAYNAGSQVYKIIKRVSHLLKKQTIAIPLFVAMSSDDETISDQAIISFFLSQPNAKNKLIAYTNDTNYIDNHKIIIRPSHFPNLKILNFSHTCLTISPENRFLGKDSQFFDLNHYPNIAKVNLKDCYQGAITKSNLKNFLLSRLCYNPDFKNLLNFLDDFLANM